MSCQQTALQNLQQKANKVALLICNSPLTRQGAFLAYTTVYNPTIRYTLPQSYFPRRSLDKAQASSFQRILSKCGFNRHLDRAIAFAPLDYAGCGFLPWYLLQGEGQVTSFIKHWRTDTLISKTLRIALSWAQWQSGYSVSILEDVETPCPYLECRWLRSLRTFLHDIQAQILVDTPYIPLRERRKDIYIMQLCTKMRSLHSSGFNDYQLLSLVPPCHHAIRTL